MKKIVYLPLLTCCLFLLSNKMWAENNIFDNGQQFKYECSTGIGLVPISAFVSWDGFYDSHTILSISDIYKNKYGKVKASPLITAEFAVLLKSWLTMSANIGFSRTSRPMRKYVPEVRKFVWAGNDISRYLSLYLQTTFNYINTPYVVLYSSLGLGIGSYGKDVGPVFQVAPLGIKSGKRLFCFFEYGLGTLYIGFRGGVGYRF